MPLPGVLLAPVTILFGPSATYNLLAIALPGLLSYAMYRVARLFLPSQISAIAAGGFFGYSRHRRLLDLESREPRRRRAVRPDRGRGGGPAAPPAGN